MSKPVKTEAERIAAWKEQRAQLAAADEAERRERASRPAPAPQDTDKDAVTVTAPEGAADMAPVAPATDAPEQDAGPAEATAPAPETPAPDAPAASTPAPEAPAPESPAPTAAKIAPEAESTAPEPAPTPEVTRSPAELFLDSVRASAPNALAKDAPDASTGRMRLALVVVVLPMLLVAAYLALIATPLYEARSVIAITRTGDAGISVQAGLLGGEKPANLQDVFRADTFIKSRAVMDSLEEDLGLVSDLSGEAIDPLRRLRDIPFLSISKHDQFDRFVQSSVDVQSGLLTLYVRAQSPEKAVLVSEAVLRHAEAQVSRLGQALFDQRLSDAAAMRIAAEDQVKQAQDDLVTLQLRFQDVDPRQRVANIYARIRELEDEAYRTRNEIQKLQIAGVGSSRQTEQLEALVLSLEAQIGQQRAQLVSPDGGSATPLNNMLIDYERATLALDLARESVRTAIETEAETTREAALNRSHFQVVVPPGTADQPLYPRSFATLLVSLVLCLTIFAGILSLRNARY
ncbi:hypothetical protein [Maliponia aquimaris]|uniref:Chain length determinant protein n=1 Tax=Maliponia aquimaris TaxID=1673631 RepID=A0A238K0U3_9RHOB|nr:hypothetical protein [Maliponia aquimaris]SMX36505.1 Chain length determinant protein [Maliponia aquimaris]